MDIALPRVRRVRRAAQSALIRAIRSLAGWYVLRRPALLALAALIAVIVASRRSGLLDRPAALDASRFAGSRCALIGVVDDLPDARATGVAYSITDETAQPA